MAPKRKAAMATTGPVSASQPTPQRPITRGIRKRRHSDASEVSEAASFTSFKAASTTSSKVIRRTTRQATREEMEQVAEQEEISENEAPPACGPQPERQVEEEDVEDDVEIEPFRPSKKVRISMSSPPEYTDQTPAPQRKMAIKRRISGMTHSGKTVRMSRTSFGPNVAEATQTVRDFTYSPLSTVIAKRMQDRKDSSPNGRIPDDEDEAMSDRLVLDTHDEAFYPQLGSLPLTPAPNGASLADGEAVVLAKRTSSSMSEEERTNLSNAVVHLQREANIATAKLRVQHIQVQALGFGDWSEEETDEAKAEIVLKSIRQSFEACRAFLHEALPGSLPDGASNEDILSILKANNSEFANRLIRADEEAMSNATITTDLTNQISHLLDRLADEKLKNGQLRKDHDVSIERLTTSLNEYIAEEKRLNELITRMESEHSDTVIKMNSEREKTVRGLEEERDRLAELLNDRVAQYENLQDRIKVAEAERDHFNELLENAKEDLDAETDAKETAEADLAAQQTEMEDLQRRINSLDEELEDLNLNIDSLRTLKDSENSQRLAAELELDKKNQDVDVLEEKLRNDGKEANELRAKIFELQNQKTKLEQAATQRDQQYESNLAFEVGQREAAVELGEERQEEITRLGNALKDIEERIGKLLAERDERISGLEDSVTQKDAEMQGMEADHKVELEKREETIAELRANIDEWEDAYQNSQQEAANFQAQVQDRDTTITGLQEQMSSLEREQTSLEGRVGEEAVHALGLTNTVFALEAELKEREAKLKVVYEKRANEEKVRKKLEEAKDAEIAGVEARHERKIETTQVEIDDLKQQFAAFVRRAHDAITHQQDAHHARMVAEDAQSEALKVGFQQQLDALNGTVTPTTVLSVQQQQKVMRKPQRKSKRQEDSGIGLEGGVMDEEMVGA